MHATEGRSLGGPTASWAPISPPENSGAPDPFDDPAERTAPDLAAASPATTPRRRRGRGRNLLIGTIALGFAATVAVIGYRVLVITPRILVAEETPAKTAAAAVTPVEVSASAAAVAAQVRIIVSSVPSGALVTVLGERTPRGRTPLEVAFDASSGTAVLRIELSGHQPVERAVMLEKDDQIEIPLLPIKPLASHHHSSRTGKGADGPSRRPGARPKEPVGDNLLLEL